MLRRTVAAMLVARRCVSLAAKHRAVVVEARTERVHGRVAGEGVARQGDTLVGNQLRWRRTGGSWTRT